MAGRRIIIIGSGIGGLLCGYLLSKEGLDVTVLEKHTIPGGNLQCFSRNGYEFETGVHYIGALENGQTLYKYWKYFALAEKIRLKKLDEDGFDRIVFGEQEFALAQGFDNFTEKLSPYFGGDNGEVSRFIANIRDVVSLFPLYNLEHQGEHRELQYAAKSAQQFFSTFKSVSPVSPLINNGKGPYQSRLITLGSVLAGNNYLYAGNSASPLHMAALINHSFISSAYRLVGGSGQIANLLVSAIRSHGGNVLTGHEVKFIDRQNNSYIVTTTAGDGFEASMVISDIHPARTVSMMQPGLMRTAFRSRIATLANTASPFMLFLSLKKGSFPYLNHNVFYHRSADVWSESEAKGSDWPQMYLLSMGCLNPDQKFAETVTIMTYLKWDEVKAWEHSRHGRRDKNYREFKEERASRLLQMVGQRFPQLVSSIQHVTAATPLTFRDYLGNPEGSLYGIQKDWNDPVQTSVVARTKLPGFFFTGQNTNLHGVLGVTIGSVITCGEILGLGYVLKKIKDAVS